jgi:hypothetical protein
MIQIILYNKSQKLLLEFRELRYLNWGMAELIMSRLLNNGFTFTQKESSQKRLLPDQTNSPSNRRYMV